jgi:agmatine deiminase
MHKEFKYYKDMRNIYLNLSNVLSENNIKQSFIVPTDFKDSEFFVNFDQNMNLIKYDCDDIWIRDYYPKIYLKDKRMYKLDFDYNAYGEKYPFAKDNNFKNILNQYNTEFNLEGYILEGGNIEFSRKGAVMLNARCFKKNNLRYSSKELMQKIMSIKSKLCFSELYTIDIENIQGDDTNGHIDNLIRFIDDENVVYFASNDREYNNYYLAKELEHQLFLIKKKSKIIKNIFPVFHNEDDIFFENGQYYPYSKLNFIITSSCIIFPSIKNNESKLTKWIDDIPSKKNKFSINCKASLLENGGLHCLSANI